VRDAARVRVVERLQDFADQLRQRLERRLVTLVDVLAQRLGLDHLHRHPGRVGVLAVLVHRGDVGVVELAADLRLALQPLDVAGLGERLGHGLHCHLAADVGVVRAVDDAGSPLPDLAHHHVLADLRHQAAIAAWAITGSTTVNRVPTPGRESTSITPPCACTIR
jgi:hypothetical protein